MTFLFIFGFLLYFLPSFIASLRHCKRGAAIVVINLFLGWTILGWIVALAWAVSGDPDFAHAS